MKNLTIGTRVFTYLGIGTVISFGYDICMVKIDRQGTFQFLHPQIIRADGR